MYQSGCRPVLYFKHYLTDSQAEDFNNADLQKYYELVSVKLSCNYYLKIIGVEEQLKEEVTSTIETLNANKIVSWIASGDTLERVLPVAYASKILPELITTVHFNNDI